MKVEEAMISQYKLGYQVGVSDEKNRIESELAKYHNDIGMIEVQKVIDIIEEVE